MTEATLHNFSLPLRAELAMGFTIMPGANTHILYRALTVPG
jgi:hypothetical protein